MGNVTFTQLPQVAGRQAPVSYGAKRRTFVYAKFTMNASYATGGDTLDSASLPTNIGSLKAVFITPNHDGTRTFTWDGSTSTPKIKAFDAFATEEGAGTDVSGTTIHVILVYEQG